MEGFAYEDYVKSEEENPGMFCSYRDFLGASAMGLCEDCQAVVEYDEVDENGVCFNCQSRYEDEMDD